MSRFYGSLCINVHFGILEKNITNMFYTSIEHLYSEGGHDVLDRPTFYLLLWFRAVDQTGYPLAFWRAKIYVLVSYRIVNLPCELMCGW